MPSRRRLLACLTVAAAWPAARAWAAADPPWSPDGFRTLEWDALVPPDWDPTRLMKDKSAGMPADDADPRAVQALKDMREIWDSAPVQSKLNGQRVRLPGYIVPLEQAKGGGLKEFLLVPYFGACIHTPPPPANQIVYVIAPQPATGFKSMDAVWVSGTLKTLRNDSGMGVSGYQMEAAGVERYSAK